METQKLIPTHNKRVKTSNQNHVEKKSQNNNNKNNSDSSSSTIGIQSLPIEILVEILSYLNSRDLHTLEEVSKFFETLVRQPSVWKAYEIKEHDPETYIIIAQLKRMPLLERLTIETRPDCDDILEQLSRSNRKLERLRIVDCTGSTGKLYLRSSYLTRILERCNRLHTIHILGSRLQGRKFYRLLGDMNTRLRTLSTQATSSQFRTFAKHASHFNDRDRKVICNMCIGGRTWAPLRYFMLERPDYQRPLAPIRRTVLVSYLHKDFLSIDVTDTDKPTSTTSNPDDSSLRNSCP
ncbi:uncharacterized protein LOC130676277 [Microplitis mediator]|uniref:uncharacterized protein LOC130676277 n=1 Tax=Microplitis mediator TaxID=375433 RepID=UPI002552C937|nr:uncharacterized protein LOC130676277 [Microplitis mediator]